MWMEHKEIDSAQEEQVENGSRQQIGLFLHNVANVLAVEVVGIYEPNGINSNKNQK